MLELLGTLLGGGAGGIIGAVGGLVSKFIEQRNNAEVERIKLEELRIQTAHEATMQDKQLEQLKVEAQFGLQKAGIEADASFDTAAFAALKSSYESDKATYATGDTAKNSPWFIAVDFCRGITRPLLTWVLDGFVLLLTVYLVYTLADQLKAVAATDGVALVKQLVNSIIFLATAGTTYWFSSRDHTRKK